MKKNIGSTLFLLVILIVAPFTKADTIQIFNYKVGQQPYPVMKGSQEKRIEHIKYLINNLNELLEKTQKENEVNCDQPLPQVVEKVIPVQNEDVSSTAEIEKEIAQA